jgi:ParB-like chromosome segregation protein Spo0J
MGKNKDEYVCENILPVMEVKLVDRSWLSPNDYNPNKVLRENLELLRKSILMNGWTLPIVARPDGTIIDGFHRWMVSGEEPLVTLLKGKVPVVIVNHKDESNNIYGTITHNRARGTHLLEPMEAIVQRLIDAGDTIDAISKQLGMKKEEIFRLSGISREDFLKLMNKGQDYSKETVFKATVV